MKLIGVYSSSHETLKDEWFLPTLKDDYEVSLYPSGTRGRGTYMEEDWKKTVLFKSQKIIEAIQVNWGATFVYSDMDVAFFAPTKHLIASSLNGKDIVCQLDDPAGNLCTGFFALRANQATLKLWQQVHKAIEREGRDQPAFNRLARAMKDLRAGYLPISFFGMGTFSGRHFPEMEHIYVPANPVMFHANWTREVEHKTALLSLAQRIIQRPGSSRALNNFLFRMGHERRTPETVDRVIRRDLIGEHYDRDAFVRPSNVAFDLSTACQLRCPSCPTATGDIAKSIGTGVLRLANFEKFLHEHPWISDIELSNWGEVFLNPDLESILRHAHERGVALRIDNGANLDRASDRALEAVVKYQLRSLSCSIDGASQEVYSIYRVNGDFDRVIEHIRQINAFKKQYGSPYPALRWQYVAFGHNEHEIGKARELARELGMEFYVKLSWDDLYGETFSPIIDRELISDASELGVADRQEYEEKFNRNYIAPTCHQLWLRPRINFDGRVLGCSINHWDDFGNVFADGLEACLKGEKMQRTKDMLIGLTEPDAASPCLKCSVYASMVKNNAWIKPQELMNPLQGNGLGISSPRSRAYLLARRLYQVVRRLRTTGRRSEAGDQRSEVPPSREPPSRKTSAAAQGYGVTGRRARDYSESLGEQAARQAEAKEQIRSNAQRPTPNSQVGRQSNPYIRVTCRAVASCEGGSAVKFSEMLNVFHLTRI